MKDIIKQIAGSAYTTMAGIRNTEWATKYIVEHNIPGDLVECGVANGAQISVMGVVLKELGVKRKIWAYDSFEGIPLASESDGCQPGIGYFSKLKDFVKDKESLLVSSGVSVCSKKNVEKNLIKWGLDLQDYNLVEGWFQHTLKNTLPDTISLLRLDGDLYESTKVCLEYLYPLLSVGGICIVDDHELYGCEKACSEYFQKIGISPELYSIGEGKENYGSVYFFKGA